MEQENLTSKELCHAHEPRLAERLNAEAVAKLQQERDRLEQCHREGWTYAREVEDEYRRRTGRGFGDPEPPIAAQSTEYKIGDRVSHDGHITEVVGVTVNYILCDGAVVYAHDLRPVLTKESSRKIPDDRWIKHSDEKADGSWNPYGSDGMRHMENSDVTGGETDAHGDDCDCADCARKYFELTGHYPTCGVGERTQQGPCNCRERAAPETEATPCPNCGKDEVGTFTADHWFLYGVEKQFRLVAEGVLFFRCMACSLEFTGEDGEQKRLQAVRDHLARVAPSETDSRS